MNSGLIYDIANIVLASMPNVDIDKLTPYEKADFEKTLKLASELSSKGEMTSGDLEMYSVYIDTLLNFELINAKETMRLYIDSALGIAVSVASLAGNTLSPGSGRIIETIGTELVNAAKDNY